MRRWLWFVLLLLLVSCGSSMPDGAEVVQDAGDTAEQEYSEGLEGQAGISVLPSPNAPRKIGDIEVGQVDGVAMGDRVLTDNIVIFLPFITQPLPYP